MIHRLIPVFGLFFLAACASPEGPGGALETVSPATPQPVTQVQTAPLPGAVAAQPLGTPNGTPISTPNAQAVQTAQQPGSIPLQPGSLSTSPPTDQFGQTTTLQDFSRIDPRAVPGSDPFADQRSPNANPLNVTQQQSLQDAVQSGLQQPQPVAQPAAPQWPRVSLAPITTAPEPQATQLFDAIDDAAFDRGLQFAFFGDETAQYVVRSQVSAIPADQVTSVIYVFDIFDARGNLRHRVSGARSIPRSGPDGWALVDATTTELIAQDVANRMMIWLRSNPS
ncbi:MAG: hypothetical protein AB8B88_13185 [Devosiaceae bacterium]